MLSGGSRTVAKLVFTSDVGKEDVLRKLYQEIRNNATYTFADGDLEFFLRN